MRDAMTRRLALLCAVALAALVTYAPTAAAGGPGGPGRGHVARLLDDLDANAARLGISDDTVKQIHGLVAEGRGAAEGMRAELTTARSALRDLLSAPQPDEAAVMAQARQIGALETKLLELRLHTLLRIRPLLTTAQVEALRAVRQQRLAPVRQDCDDEIAASCADAVTGRETVRCLIGHRDHLSAPCRAALDALRRAPHP